MDAMNLHLAAEKGNVEQVKELLKKEDPNKQDELKQFPLHYAAVFGQDQVIDVLLSAGADINCRTQHLTTPLHYAARNGRRECVEKLVEAGCDISPKDSDEWTPLHYACFRAHTATVEFLLQKGAQTNEQTSKGLTPLHLACNKGYRDICSLLISHGGELGKYPSSTGRLPFTLLRLKPGYGILDTEKIESQRESYYKKRCQHFKNLLDEQMNCDITFEVIGKRGEPRQLKAHRLFLRHHVDKLTALVEGSDSGPIDFKSYHFDALHMIFEYFYTGVFDLKPYAGRKKEGATVEVKNEETRPTPMDVESKEEPKEEPKEEATYLFSLMDEIVTFGTEYQVFGLIDFLGVAALDIMNAHNVGGLLRVSMKLPFSTKEEEDTNEHENTSPKPEFHPLFYHCLEYIIKNHFNPVISIPDVLDSITKDQLISVLPHLHIMEQVRVPIDQTPAPPPLAPVTNNTSETTSTAPPNTAVTSSPRKLEGKNLRLATSLLSVLMRHKHAFPFNQPVDPVSLNIPEYFDIIKQPMDLGTVKDRLKNGYYSDYRRLMHDIRLTFENAMSFNMPVSEVYKWASELLSIFNKKIERIVWEKDPFMEEGGADTLPDQIEEDTRPPMTLAEKKRLGEIMGMLNSAQLAHVITIAKVPQTDTEDIVLDLNTLDNITLRKLYEYARKCLNENEGQLSTQLKSEEDPQTKKRKL